ncbi:reverse transcriptase/maturase family protein, partial [Thiolapillus sp.]|uniref:reverse transcriptase/maturase family protein n=1 Tax=Thiolapillus sp. TaxID=2017437 RepID=UPI003AF62D8C
KIVQSATAEILNSIYESDFAAFSYGFRPGKSQHQALQALQQACLRPRDRFWDIPVPKIDSAFDNLFVPQPSWSPSTTQQLRKLVAAPYLAPNDWTPRSEAYVVFPLAQGTPGKQCGLAATGVYQPSLRSPWLAATVLQKGKVNWVLDLDLKACFDRIDHTALMDVIQKRIADKRLLNLIQKWLTVGCREEGQKRQKQKRGTPQGAIISPLLANIVLNEAMDSYVRHWRKRHAR